MFARRRPLLRAAVVGGGAYMAGKRMGQRQSDQQEQFTVPSQASSSESTQSVPDQLAKLTSLHQQGALDDAEFASAKARLLGGLPASLGR